MLTKRHVLKLRLFTLACYDNVLPLVSVLETLWNTLWQILGGNLRIFSDMTMKIVIFSLSFFFFLSFFRHLRRTFAESRLLTSSCLSVHPSVQNSSHPTEEFFWIYVLKICTEILKTKIHFSWNRIKITETLSEDLVHLCHWLLHPRQEFLREIWVEAEETVNDLETTAEKVIYVRKAEVEETADYQILSTLNLLTWIEQTPAKRLRKIWEEPHS
jgi:hypothetical protein